MRRIDMDEVLAVSVVEALAAPASECKSVVLSRESVPKEEFESRRAELEVVDKRDSSSSVSVLEGGELSGSAVSPFAALVLTKTPCRCAFR